MPETTNRRPGRPKDCDRPAVERSIIEAQRAADAALAEQASAMLGSRVAVGRALGIHPSRVSSVAAKIERWTEAQRIALRAIIGGGASQAVPVDDEKK